MKTSKTLSTSAVNTEQGTHVFHIAGYSQQRALGGLVRSGWFSVGGHRWLAFLHLDGSKVAKGIDENRVTAGVLLADKNSKVFASYEMRLVDQSTGLSFSVHKVAPREFDHGNGRGYSAYSTDRSVFEESTVLQDDCLTMECVITVVKPPRKPQVQPFPRIEVPPSDITAHFAKLLEEKKGVDVEFSVQGKNFAAHKIVLATRSPVFEAELYGPMKEAGTEPIIIRDVQPQVFRALLHFIYTDSLPPFDDNMEEDDHREMIRHLLVAADRYAMERLKLMCQSMLCENLNVQTVAITLALADQHNCGMLKDACIEFMSCSSVMDAVEATQGYKNLKRICPSVVVEALEKRRRSCKE